MRKKVGIPLRRLAALGVCAAAIVPGAAEAVVRYDLTGQQYQFRQFPGESFTPPPFSLSLVVSDAAAARGSFAISGGNIGPGPGYSGDVVDFVSLLIGGGIAETYTQASALGTINVALTLGAGGVVASSAISYLGGFGSAALAGAGSGIAGFYGTEQPACTAPLSQQKCGVSGVLTQVPEPASAALLGMALLGAMSVRRRA